MLGRRELLAGGTAVFSSLPALARAEAAPIRIGAPLPLTGSVASEGAKQRNGMSLWADMVNQAGGVDVGGTKRKIELVIYDYESATPKAVQVTEKLISSDKVDFLFSPFGSGAAKAAAMLSQRYKIVTMSASASSKEVFVGVDTPYLFGILCDNKLGIQGIATYLAQHAPQIKRLAVYARNDLIGLSMAGAVIECAKEGGFELLSYDKFPAGAPDHAAALTGLLGARADWLFMVGYTDDLILIRKQMAEVRLSAPVVTMIAGPAYPDFIQSLGPLADDVTSQASWFPQLRSAGKDVFGSTAAYADRFKSRFGVAADYISAATSAAGVVLQTAIERVGSIDTAKVRSEIATGQFDTFYGRLHFGANGQNDTNGSPVFQIQDGKMVVLAPAEKSEGTLRLIS